MHARLRLQLTGESLFSAGALRAKKRSSKYKPDFKETVTGLGMSVSNWYLTKPYRTEMLMRFHGGKRKKKYI